jgi:hypothetical protein
MTRFVVGLGSVAFLGASSSFLALAQVEGNNEEKTKYTPPPVIVSFDEFSQWTADAVERIHPGMALKIVGTDEWAGYLNKSPDAPVKHYIDKACEGLKPGETYDFNYVEDKEKRPRLGSAGITENGVFYFWWHRCNFYEIAPEVCRDELIPVFVFHEGIHWKQRNRLVEETIEEVLGDSAPEHGPVLPLAEIEALPKGKKIKKKFMERWTSCDHYRCREIEAYMAEIEQGYTPDWEVPDLLPVIADSYSQCREGQAADYFEADLAKAEALLAKHKYDPASQEQDR